MMIYDGEYSVIFTVGGESRHSWNDWFLAPVQKPVITIPEAQEFSIEAEGINGKIDFADGLFTRVPLKNRTGSLEFYIDHDNPKYPGWPETISMITSFLHSKWGRITLTEDPSYYYEGRFYVNEFKANADWSTVVIDYDLEPMKKTSAVVMNAFRNNSEGAVIHPSAVGIIGSEGESRFTLSANTVLNLLSVIGDAEFKIDSVSVTPTKETQTTDFVYVQIYRSAELGYGVNETLRFVIEPGGIKKYTKKYDEPVFVLNGEKRSDITVLWWGSSNITSVIFEIGVRRVAI